MLTASWKMVYVTIIDSVKIDKIFSKIIDSRLPFRFRNALTGSSESKHIFQKFVTLSMKCKVGEFFDMKYWQYLKCINIWWICNFYPIWISKENIYMGIFVNFLHSSTSPCKFLFVSIWIEVVENKTGLVQTSYKRLYLVFK